MIALQKKQAAPSVFTKPPPVPVLHIIKSLGRGGAEILLPETLHMHDKDKFNFHYIYFLPWKNQVVKQIEEEGGTVTCMSAKNNLQIMLRLRSIIAYAGKHEIKLIHCHLPWAGIVGRLAGSLAGIPVIYTEHNKWERYHKLTYWANRLSFSKQEKVIAVSNEVANSIKQNYKGNKPSVSVILNGIDTGKFSPAIHSNRDIRKELNVPADAVVIGITCVFRAQKRLTTWVEIAVALHAIHPGIHFIIVGDGILREQVHHKAEQLQTENYLHFTGLQTDTRPFLKAMDIFMMSSEFEGLPIALLEAMSMGCMPACTGAGGIPELLSDKENGVLVPVDQPMQLVNRLAEYLQSPGKINRFKQAARETVIKSFSMQRMVTQLEALYHETLNPLPQ